MKLTSKVKKYLAVFFEGRRGGIAPFFFINVFLVVLQVLYILSRYKYLNSEIPFWFGKSWGDYQLAPKNYIYFLPMVSGGLVFVASLIRYVNRLYLRYFDEIISYFISAINIFIFYSIFYIIQSASTPFPPFIPAKYLSLVSPFLLAFILIYVLLPYVIDFAHKKRLVTDPSIHRHPAMLLAEPSARGGGFVYAVIFLLMSIVFVGTAKQFVGIYLSVFMLAILGMVDDIPIIPAY